MDTPKLLFVLVSWSVTFYIEVCFLIIISMKYYFFFHFTLTQSQLLPRVRGQSEAQHRHGGDQEARHDQVEEVVHCPPPDLDCVGDVKIRLGTAVVNDLISFCRNTLIKNIKIMENSFSFILSFNTISIPRCFHLSILLQ